MDALPNEEMFLRMDDFSGIPPYAMPQSMQPVTPIPMMPWESYGIAVNPFPMQLMQPQPQPQIQPQPQQQEIQVQQIEKRPIADAALRSSNVPLGPDAIRGKLRESLTEALKLVASEQPKDELATFLEGVVICKETLQELAGITVPVVRKPRSKLQVFGGKGSDGSPCKRMRLDSADDFSWEEKIAEHSKFVSKNIEIELLRAFRAVNKKYRERARSLVFNLKNNPDLRARVFVGEITPEALCSMTVEQLAPKELSQWRMAKAVERAHMVVITDEDINTSKLVKKTHKGEIVMEADHEVADVSAPSVKVTSEGNEKDEAVKRNDDDEEEVAEEPEETIDGKEEAIDAETIDAKEEPIVGKEETEAGASSPAKDEAEAAADVLEGAEEVVLGDKEKNLEESSDGLLDVSDFKGLPEIMSMDGFLKSLGCAQREDGSAADAQVVTTEEADTEMKDAEDIHDQADEAGDSSQPAEARPNNPLKRSLPEINKQDSSKCPRPTVKQESPRQKAEEVSVVSGKEAAKPRELQLWDGSLQLTGARSTAVHAVFRSGQDVKLNAWPKLLEVKGRVKLGPLAKFLKDLCLSKSRAVTAVTFYSSDMATSSLSLLKEVVDQYEKSERVGYVEPGAGYELYLFPPGKATWKFLTENGRLKPSSGESAIPEVLVGCIVWRKSPSDKTSGSKSEKSKKSSSSSKNHHHHHHQHHSSSKSSGSASRSKHHPSPPPPPPASTARISPPSRSAADHTAASSLAASSSAMSSLSASSSAMLLQQSSVVKHSVNEWPQHQSSLCSPTPVGDPLHPPPFALEGQQQYHQLQHQHRQQQQQQQQQQPGLLPSAASFHQISSALGAGSKIPGYEAGPPGFFQLSSWDLDDLPEYDYEGLISSSSRGGLSYGPSTSTTIAPVSSAGVGGFQGMVKDGFQGFQGQVSVPPTSASSSEMMRSGDWSRTGGIQQMFIQHQQHQQHQAVGRPPLPPGPPPPTNVASYGHWVHPNQAAHQQKSAHSGM